jgi:16S rRNA (adenine1518-N6/adenine1519-N6)-dimethyltransferase
MGGEGESLAGRTRRLLAELGLRPRKERGQSFLIDPSIAERTTDAICEGGTPKVLEIGAGLAALTERLADRAQAVVAVELQPEFVQALAAMFADRPQVCVVEADALRTDLADLVGGSPSEWRVGANLPYYAASAILLRLFEVKPPFQRVVVMVQREVGERLTARPGHKQYGSLSVVAAYHTSAAKVVLRVPRGAFYPQPKVDSVVLALEPRRGAWSGLTDEALLFEVIRAGFGQRRKQLVNTIARAACFGPVDRGTADAALAAAGIPPRARAEELDLETFIALTNALAESGVRALASG